ncbi:MAG: dinitrogenase iron-molybdenum cofactor biosynthesis protein [Nitrospiraceae bacterium]|nr:dinitrogenase iron-molybdenum cofactor biosynthesis protein [Nitrospiraceae bacterium]
MKIAITAQGTELTSPVDPRFGRAKNFVVVDTDSGDYTAHDNTQNLNAAQGAGIQAARNVVDSGAEAVLTGNVGPKAFAALQTGNVQICIGASGTVSEALEAYQNGTLQACEQPNVDSHWL